MSIKCMKWGVFLAAVPALFLQGCGIDACPEIVGFGGKLVDAETAMDFNNGEIVYQGQVTCDSEPDEVYPIPSLGKLRSRIRKYSRELVLFLDHPGCPTAGTPNYDYVQNYILDKCFPKLQVRLYVKQYAVLTSERIPLVVGPSFVPTLNSEDMISVPYVSETSRDIRTLSDKESMYIRLHPDSPRVTPVAHYFTDPDQLVVLQTVASFMADAVTEYRPPSKQVVVCPSKVYDSKEEDASIQSLAVTGGLVVLYTANNLSESSRDQLFTMVGDESLCAICIDPLVDGSSVRILPCNHCFHEHCLGPWVKTKANCPSCRRHSN